jgi:predicted DCC family thiol-disulfide oxidoreductase YuxK
VPKPEAVLVYDGTCGFCSASVRFVLQWERSSHLYFSPLESSWSKTHLTDAQRAEGKTSLLLLENGVVYSKSGAVLRLARRLRMFWFLGYIGFGVPRFLRDAFYSAVSRNRQHLPGKCELLNKERFLD